MAYQWQQFYKTEDSKGQPGCCRPSPGHRSRSVPHTVAQKTEHIALTRALEIGKDKRVNIYIDSKYAFLVLHAHAAIWKEKGF